MEQFIATCLLGLALVLIPAMLIAKIKYFKFSRKQKYRGLIELILPFSIEWWIAAITWWIPFFRSDSEQGRETLRRIANFRIYLFYTAIFIALMALGI